jgi:thiol-disulfide isomerase/thioredoxin
MTVRQQWSIVGAVVLLIGGGLFAATKLMGGELFPVSVGSQAPQFHATVVEPSGPTGPVRTLDDYRGKVVLVNVWATWCGPCRQEAPTLEKLYQEYGPKGFKIVAISVDDGPGAEQKVRDFVKEFGLTFDILHDGTGAIERAYQVSGYPENFVIDRHGVIRKKVYTQDWTQPGNRALIAQLLAEGAQVEGTQTEGTP